MFYLGTELVEEAARELAKPYSLGIVLETKEEIRIKLSL